MRSNWAATKTADVRARQSRRGTLLVRTGNMAKTGMRPQGHDSPKAPIAALGLCWNVSFPRQYLKACSRSALPAEQSANSCQRPRPRFLGSLHRMVAVTLWSRKRRYWY